MRGRAWRSGGLLVGAAALALAACQPVAPPAPPSACGKQVDEPTPAHPVDYVAVVDDPGATSPDVVTFTATSEKEVDDKVAELEQQQGDVVSVEPDTPVEAVAVNPANEGPEYAQQYGLHGPNGAAFPNAWAAGPGGTGVTIAVVDTGVQATHPDLAAQVLPGVDFVTGATDGRSDPNGHGTHVAGIAAAADNTAGGLGGAPLAQILPVVVLNSQGSGSTSVVAQGVFWATDNGADVINLSLGGCNASAAMSNAVSYATNNNVVLVAAAGNAGTASTIYPAAYDAQGAIAVASTDSGGNKSSFSNFGSSVDIAAPGASIVSTLSNGSYGTKSGTSMASPFVAAAAALLIDQCPGINPGQVLHMLRTYAAGPVPGYGFNRLQASAAVGRNCVL